MSVIAREEIVEKIEQIAERVAQPEGLEIVEGQLFGSGRGRLLPIFIDRPAGESTADQPHGVSHADCEFISHQVGTILDIEDVIPGDSYTLEVSSPGLERKLSTPRDFERVVGKKLKVVLVQPRQGQASLEGRLRNISAGVLALEQPDGELFHIPLDQVRKANLKFDW